MRFLEIIRDLGKTTKSETEKELLEGYYKRIREMLRNKLDDAEIERSYCLMIACYILGYIDKNVDYKNASTAYYDQFLSHRINVEAIA